MSPLPALSFVIPAYNASATVGETLASLLAQTRADWEAIVVDDGSTDETAVRAAIPDARVSVVAQPHAGAAAARNEGLARAGGEWVVFLDADDWIAPEYVERILTRAAECPDAEAIHCGWARVGPDGRATRPAPFTREGQLADVLSARCAFAIHACAVRRPLVVSVNGFDPSLACCESWDLWQRVAQTGATFASIPECLAFCRLRADSASVQPGIFLRDGWRVLERGHEGREDDLSTAKLRLALWAAGLSIGQGGTGESLLADAGLAPVAPGGCDVGEALHGSVPQGAGLTPADWSSLWPGVAGRVASLLQWLERWSGRAGLARASERDLAERILTSPAQLPATIGSTHGVEVQALQPIDDVVPPPGCDRVVMRVTAGGFATHVTLPVCAGAVPAGLVRDAIAGAAAWPLLGAYLERAVYPTLERVEQGDTRDVRRDGLVLATGATRGLSLHDQIGWTVWLQEMWEQPAWTDHEFYGTAEAPGAVDRIVEGTTCIEVGEPLPHLIAPARVRADVLVGGTPLGVIFLEPGNGRVSAARLRTTILETFGMELCRAVVREAVAGHAADDGAGIGRRLATRARERAAGAPAWHATADPAVSHVVGRREPAILGTSLSRRALLPAGARDEVTGSAAACAERVVTIDGMSAGTVAYDPGLLPDTGVSEPGSESAFERLFQQQEDPWNYGTPYERRKYEQTLSLIEGRRFEHALELACAEGHFTERLAAQVDDLLATDISAQALARTAARCRALPHVHTRRLDLRHDDLPSGAFDLIVCSEVLYYIGGRIELAEVAKKIATALRPGGMFLTAHANVASEEPGGSGFAWDHPFGARGIASVLDRTPGLVQVGELVTPLYRIGLYEKRARQWWQPRPPVARRTDDHAPVTAAVASQIRWATPREPSAEHPVLSRRVPILMYHRVSPERGPLRRYCLTPDEFGAQLECLAQDGYHSIGLDAWRDAVEHRRNIPGRPIIITFDDGYVDFEEHAWPLLERFGFGATLFVVTAHVGGTSAWDHDAARPLLDWAALRRLRAKGLRLGAHSHTHPALTGADVVRIAREAAVARREMADALGEAVSAFAFPYGEHDAVVRHLVGACGYRFGLTVRPGAAGFGDDLLNLPRFEAHSGLSIDAFRTMLRDSTGT
jgi:peptidoglycan/xylan/chitin deacetylase (PgdA/CDA1 family)/SAM-dependent methyltransferase